MRRFLCSNCWDTGKIGLIFKKICPNCNGDPRGNWEKLHPRPNPPIGIISRLKIPKREIHIYIHEVKS